LETVVGTPVILIIAFTHDISRDGINAVPTIMSTSSLSNGIGINDGYTEKTLPLCVKSKIPPFQRKWELYADATYGRFYAGRLSSSPTYCGEVGINAEEGSFSIP